MAEELVTCNRCYGSGKDGRVQEDGTITLKTCPQCNGYGYYMKEVRDDGKR